MNELKIFFTRVESGWKTEHLYKIVGQFIVKHKF
jgi:hypothetical protein